MPRTKDKQLLTRYWTPFKYHEQQSKLWRTKSRFVAVAAGRGSGKTELARRRIVRFLPVRKPWPDPVYFYALPTINQAKRLAWKQIKNLIPANWIVKCNETDLVIETVFGSTLFIMGMDRPNRAEGLQYDGGILDESCDQKPKVFDLSVLPALSHRNGWCWRIGVPKRHGIGARDFRKFYDLGLGIKQEDEEENSELDIQVESFTWPSSSILSKAQLIWAQTNLEARDYNEQYNASWETASGAVFYAYDDKLNIDETIQYNPKLPLIIGQDFNVDPMCWVVMQHIDDSGYKFNPEHSRVNVIDEIILRNTNTPATLDVLFKRYGDHQSGFNFYGDASGRARKTSASMSDYLLIKQDRRFKNASVFFLKANPRIADRFAACNAMFCNAAGKRRLFIHPRCKNLRKDLLDRQYVEGSNEVDDYGDIGHMSDALGYPIHRLFPIRIVLTDKSPAISARVFK